MRLWEFEQAPIADTPEEVKESINDFIHWCCGVLKIDPETLPTIEFSQDREAAALKHRTGEFIEQSQHILVYVGRRNLVDILRTVAHELTHLKQYRIHKIKDHGPGSGPEISADMVAGYLMKVYGAKHPEIYQ